VPEAIVHLTWVDVTILGVVVISTIISVFRGFVREAFSLASWFLAFWVALRLAPQLATGLEGWVSQPTLRVLLAFVVLFVLTLIVGALITHALAGLVGASGLSGTDRVLGALFGAARGVVIILALMLLAQSTSVVEDPGWRGSTLVARLDPLLVWVMGQLPTGLTGRV
jgi:membrane protein required for colicin V production